MTVPASTTAAPVGAIPLVVGVTSHRNIAAHETDVLRARVRQLFESLQRDFPHSPLVVLSPLAEGGDQLVAEEGLKLGARVLAPLPLPPELYAQDFTDPAALARFESLRARAKTLELPLLRSHTRDAVAIHGEARNRQYAEAGMFVARHCHLLLAIWDGKSSDRPGGTAQTVDYFLTGTPPGGIERRRGRPHLYGGGDERLLCHLVCSREAPDGGPAEPLRPGQLIWRSDDAASAPDSPMPPAFRDVFAHADASNRDTAQYADEITARGLDVEDAPPGEGAAPMREASSPAVLYRAADWLAVHFQRRVLLAMRIIYVIAFAMGMTFTAYDNLPAQDDLIYVFLVMFATGMAINAIAKRREWHRKYLDYRALAEGLRVQCHWRRAGISLTGSSAFGQDSMAQKQDIELGWVRNAMRSAGLVDDPAPAEPDAAPVQGVIDDWVGDATRGELGYYRVRAQQREHTHRLNEVLGAMCLLAGICISILLAALGHWLSAGAKNELIALMAVFSIFAAVREAYSFRKADRELIRQYRFMGRVFGNARKELDGAADVREQREILRALGEVALAEHVEWAVMHRQRPLEASKM